MLPTGAAYEHPGRLVERAEAWFASLGGSARGLDVLRRPDALDPANIAAVRSARFVYLVGESPMHLRSVLKDTPMWDALVAAWQDGAVLAGSAAGAMALCDPMVDPRGGAFTLGLGLIGGLTVIPEFETWSHDAVHRTRKLCPAALALVGVPTATALVSTTPTATWRSAGRGDGHRLRRWEDGAPPSLDVGHRRFGPGLGAPGSGLRILIDSMVTTLVGSPFSSSVP